MECFAYYTDASGNFHFENVYCIKVWDKTHFNHSTPSKENVQQMVRKTGARDCIVMNKCNQLLIVPTDQVHQSENVVQLIACGHEVWYKRKNIRIVEKKSLLKTLYRFIQSKFFPEEN